MASAGKSERTITDKELIRIFKSIGDTKNKQSALSGTLGEILKDSQERLNLHIKAAKYVARLIGMNDKDELARAEFERRAEEYREAAVRQGLLPEHVGDLVDDAEPEGEDNGEGDEGDSIIDQNIENLRDIREARPRRSRKGDDAA